jgi:hypothetical protein
MGAKAIDPALARKKMISAGVTPMVAFEKGRAPWKSKCNKCNRIVTPSYLNVRNGHSPCKFCAKGGVTEKEALALLKKAGANPVAVFPGFKKPWHSTCNKCNREIYPRLNLVSKTLKACNYCNRRTVDPVEARKLALAAGVVPLIPYPGAKPWKSECKKCKSLVFPTLRRIRNGQNPCGWCARVRIDPQEAKAAFLDVGLVPIGKYPGSNTKWKSKCSNCARTVYQTLGRIQAGMSGCTFCSGRKIDPREAAAIMKAAGAIPLAAFPGGSKPWKSKCAVCLREIAPNYGNVRDGHNPCVYCSGKKVDTATAVEWAKSRGLIPLVKYPGATAKWKVRCTKCKRVDSTTWTMLQLKAKNAGCSSCTIFGFKPLEPAYLYLVTHKEKKAHKIGIGNVGAKRIERHRKNGWDIYRVRVFDKGRHAHETEQAIILWLRQEKLIAPAFRVGDGWTETMPSSLISLSSVWAKVGTTSRGKFRSVPVREFD